MNKPPMTTSRIRTFLAKFDGAETTPCAIPMLQYLLAIIEADESDRVQALLKDLLSTEKQHKQNKIVLGQWMAREIEKLAVAGGGNQDDREHQQEKPRRSKRRPGPSFG